MSIADLEIELARLRGEDRPPSNALVLETTTALAYRNKGNLPDEADRSLRLVLRVEDEVDLGSLEVKRLRFEPDFYKATSWRREGSKPVNVVPLRAPQVGTPDRGPWWDDPEMASMEAEWVETGSVAGLFIPGAYRSFVYKTIAFLRSTGMVISVDSVSDSVARWMSRTDADVLRAALADANREQ